MLKNKIVETLEIESEVVKAEDGEIIINDPRLLRPTELPLVVVLPEGSSKAQIAYAKILNSYAYQNPTKWEMKKETLIAKLKSLKNAPDPRENSALKINNSLA